METKKRGDRTSRAEEFRRMQRELTERQGIGSAELQAIYLGQIADILASIADCLEQKRKQEAGKE